MHEESREALPFKPSNSLWHGIVAARVEWMAFQDPADGQPQAARDSVLGDGGDCVLRARRDESASSREKRRDESLVKDNRRDGELAEHASILAFRLPLDN